MSEVGGRRTDVRGQEKTEVRRQKTEVGDFQEVRNLDLG